MADELIKTHVYFEHGTGKIDNETVLWFIKKFKLLKKNETNEYIYTPLFQHLDVNLNRSSNQLMLKALLSRVYPDFTTKIIFNSEDHLDSFKYHFQRDDYKNPKMLLKEVFAFNDSELLDRIVDQINFKVFSQKLYHIDPTEMKKGTYVLNIVGHGAPADEYLAGDEIKDNPEDVVYFQQVHYKDVVAKLKPHLFLDERSLINLVSCSSASNGAPIIQKTTAEIRKLFIKGVLINEFHNGLNEDQTFLFKISKEIFDQTPSWKGTIQGWFGLLSVFPVKSYVRDTEDPTNLIVEERYASGVKNSSERTIYFDKNELVKDYIFSDFF